MYAWVAGLVTRGPWWVIGAWLVATVVVVLASPSIGGVTDANEASFLPTHYDSVRAQAALDRSFPAEAGDTELLVVHRPDRAPLTPADQQRAADLAAALRRVPGVTGTYTGPMLLSPDGRVQLVEVGLAGEAGTVAVDQSVAALRAAVPQDVAGTGLAAGVTGPGAIVTDTNDAFAKAQNVIAFATVIIIITLLALIFRSLLLTVLPVALIAVVHQLAEGVVSDLAHGFHFTVGSLLAPLLIVVLFGVGTDYVVFLLFRYRERLTDGEEPTEALREAAAAVGEVVTSSGLTVAAAFAALLLSSLGLLRTLAPGLIVGVVLMVAAAVTLVPAVLAVLGPRVFWPTRRLRPAGAERFEARIGRYVGRHPGWTVLAYGGVVVVLAVVALGFRSDYDSVGELPTSSPSVEAYHQMERAFPPGAVGPTQVVVESDTGHPLSGPALAGLARRLAATPGVASVVPAQTSADGTAALLDVALDTNPYSGRAMATLTGPVSDAVRGAVPGATVLLGGATSQSVDIRNAINRDFEVVYPVAAAAIALILALLLRCLVGPLYLLVGVVLGYLATLGLLVLVFEHLFGLGGIDFSIPIVLYLFVVAIGTDYNILMTARIREELRAGRQPREAVALAIGHGAPAVAAAGIVLAGTFASLLLTNITTLSQLGAGVSIGIVIAAFFMAPRIIPAVAGMRRWHFWWPSALDRRTAPTTSHLRLYDPDRLRRVGVTATVLDEAADRQAAPAADGMADGSGGDDRARQP